MRLIEDSECKENKIYALIFLMAMFRFPRKVAVSTRNLERMSLISLMNPMKIWPLGILQKPAASRKPPYIFKLISYMVLLISAVNCSYRAFIAFYIFQKYLDKMFAAGLMSNRVSKRQQGNKRWVLNIKY